MSDRYAVGKQPCQNLKRKAGDIAAAPDLPNVHECVRCRGRVSFCENCCRDHHEDGYETCIPTDSIKSLEDAAEGLQKQLDGQCKKCGAPKESSIHATDSKNTEIRMAAHPFATVTAGELELEREWAENHSTRSFTSWLAHEVQWLRQSKLVLQGLVMDFQKAVRPDYALISPEITRERIASLERSLRGVIAIASEGADPIQQRVLNNARWVLGQAAASEGRDPQSNSPEGPNV